MAKENKISKLDKNFVRKDASERDDIIYHNVNCAPFTVYGLLWDEKLGYVRMPQKIAKAANPTVEGLNKNTAGGRVRFSTDSPVIAVKCKINGSWRMTHMSDIGTSGFDLYEVVDGKQKFIGSILPPRETVAEYSGVITLPQSGVRDLILDMPLFTGLGELLVGIQKGSVLTDGGSYKYRRPMVFYGSSITHGACASRPGNLYEGMISRRFNADYVCLGYSGGAHAEPVVMDYISKLDMSIFIYDYDHNSSSPEELESTHYNGYKTIREKNPYLPIIMASRPDYDKPGVDGKAYRDIIAKTYEKAVANGDKNVYFVDGEKEFGSFVADGYTVDTVHPNDLGFAVMARKFGDMIAKILKITEGDQNG